MQQIMWYTSGYVRYHKYKLEEAADKDQQYFGPLANPCPHHNQRNECNSRHVTDKFHRRFNEGLPVFEGSCKYTERNSNETS
ncbi:hypothetical protein D3C81_1708910 [compost metagenome]